MNDSLRPPSAPLPREAAIGLCHALVQDAAAAVDARVIFFKGLVANRHELRPTWTPSDVDVFVEHGQIDQVLHQLQKLGWYRRPESDAHRYFVTHSVSLIHLQWPIDIDLHVSFPGIFRDYGTTFERLWSQRVTLEIAHRPIQCAGAEHSFILGALHALRSLSDPRSRGELRHLHKWLEIRSNEDASAPSQLAAEVKVLAAVEVLAPEFQDDLNLTPPARVSKEMTQWNVQTRQLNRTASWLQLISQTRGARSKARLVRQAILPDREAMAIDHPGRVSTTFSLMREHAKRWRRAIEAFPIAVLSCVESRRVRGSSALSVSNSPREYGHPNRGAPDLTASESALGGGQPDKQLPASPVGHPAWSVEPDSRIYILRSTGDVVSMECGGPTDVWQRLAEGASDTDALSFIAAETSSSPDDATVIFAELIRAWDATGVSPRRPGSSS